jgi:hypothetical protein
MTLERLRRRGIPSLTELLSASKQGLGTIDSVIYFGNFPFRFCRPSSIFLSRDACR